MENNKNPVCKEHTGLHDQNLFLKQFFKNLFFDKLSKSIIIIPGQSVKINSGF